MKKILFGITSLTIGGAERVLVDLANCLSKDYKITIFTIYAKGELEKELLPNIQLKSLYPISFAELSNFQKKIGMPLKVLLNRKRIYEKEINENLYIEIYFLEGAITRLLSSQNKETKKIAWIHNDIACVFGNNNKAKLKRKIDKKIYNKYKELVFVSKENLISFERTYPEVKNRKQVIYNYMAKDKIIEKAKEEVKEKFDGKITNLISVARLVEQKGIDRLIEVHKRLIQEGLLHNFYVIGDGPEKEKLQALIKKEQVEETFRLLGKKENPYPYIKMADYFCLFSRFEGYGMVIEEAKILNKPILITNTAAKEAVQNYNHYEIAENSVDGIFELLKKVLSNKKEEIVEPRQYENEHIIEEIKKLIGE